MKEKNLNREEVQQLFDWIYDRPNMRGKRGVVNDLYAKFRALGVKRAKGG